MLRPTRRSKRAAARVAERTLPAIYSHRRPAGESVAPAAPDAGGEVVGLEALMAGPATRAGRVVVNLAPFHGRSLVHAALAAQADAVDLLVPNETDGVC